MLNHKLIKMFQMNRKHRVLLQYLFVIYSILLQLNWKCIKKWRKKLGKRKRRINGRKPQITSRKRVDVDEFDIFELTCLFKEFYEHIGNSIAMFRQQITTKRKTSTLLTTHARLLLVLHWI